MAVRIAVDLDGTLADLDGALQREAERLFGPGVDLHEAGPSDLEQAPADRADDAAANPVTAGAQPSSKGVNDRQMRELIAHVREIDDFWTTLAEVEPGAVARLAELASRFAWEVIFVTQRPSTAGETAQRQSQRWLAAHGFELPSVYVMNGSRGKLADALQLDVVLDDRPENCLDVITDSNAKAMLVWRDHPLKVPDAIGRLAIETVFSVGAALDQLEQIAEASDRPRSLIDRLRSTIGI